MSFEASFLPDSEKERLCRELLAEFGALKVKPSGDGELIHGCLIPYSNHKDQERNPTASLNYKKLTYNCLGCGHSGGLLWFIGTCRGVNGTLARQWLNDQTGGGPDEQSLSALLQFFDAVYGHDRYQLPPIPKMDERVLIPWRVIHPYLTDPQPEGRGIPEENIVHFQVGYGVLRVRLDENSWLNSHRIVIPHFWKGSLTGWQSRRLTKDGTAKYLNTPDLPKDQTIYNYDPKRRRAVVVESPMSVVAKYHCEDAMEGTFGAEITDRQIKLLSNHEKVILWFDNDTSGWKATKRVGEALLPYSDVWVVDSDWAEDAAGLTDSLVCDLLDNPVPFSLWRPPTELQVPEAA